jgi:hypothetical protein
MGVVTNQYIIVGVNLPYEALDYEQLEGYHDNGYKEEVVHKNGLTAIQDGMSGKYLVIGRIIEKAPPDIMIGDGVTTLDPVAFDKAEMIASLINLSFPSLSVSVADIRSMLVTHYH